MQVQNVCVADKPWLIRELIDFPFLPSPQAVIDAALDLLSVRKDAVFADLGCGEGDVLVRAAQKLGVFCVGYEIDQRLLPMAKQNIKRAGVAGCVDVVYADLFTVDLSKFEAIYVYPFPAIAESLAQKIHAECTRGTQVVVHNYVLPTFEPVAWHDVAVNGVHKHRVILYRV
jgi:precorrin-6B methylase 2